MAASDGAGYFADGYFAVGMWHTNYWAGPDTAGVAAISFFDKLLSNLLVPVFDEPFEVDVKC